MTKSVCLDCEPLRDPHSGFSHFVRPLAGELIRQNERFRLSCYVPPGVVGALGPGVRYVVQRSHQKYVHPGAWRFRLWHATSQLSWYVPPGPRPRVVLTVHDLNFLHESPDERTYTRQLALVRRNLARADFIATISDFVRQDILTHADLLGYRGRQPLRYVRRGVETLALPPADHTPAYRPAGPFLFALGSVNAKKNFHVLPALLPGTDLELLVAGGLAEPDYVARIRAAAAECGVANRVRVLTRISEADKAWYFQHCRAYLQPSLAEGFGLPVVEAMQLGKPVFLSELTSLPEVGGAAARYFPDFSADAMRRVLAAGLREYDADPGACAAALRAHAATFSWAQTAADYLAVYEEVLT